jgi:hypothetical protein
VAPKTDPAKLVDWAVVPTTHGVFPWHSQSETLSGENHREEPTAVLTTPDVGATTQGGRDAGRCGFRDYPLEWRERRNGRRTSRR